VLARARSAHLAKRHDIVDPHFGGLGGNPCGNRPIGGDALGERTRSFGKEQLALPARLFPERLVTFAAALEKVQKEAWPQATNADELHDALMLLGMMTTEEVRRTSDGESGEQFLSILTAENRATRLILAAQAPHEREILECGAAAPLLL